MNYLNCYDNLILKRRNFPLVKTSNGKIESHHIIPLSCGGLDINQNKINLTCREHYIAHLLLLKIYQNTQYEYSMIKAYQMMAKMSNESSNRKIINSRLYSIIRKRASDDYSKLFSKKYNYKGKLLTIKEITEKYKISATMFRYRVNNLKMTVDDAIEKPHRIYDPIIKYKGVENKVSYFAKKYKMDFSNLRHRIQVGYSVEDAIEIDNRKYKYKNDFMTLDELCEKYKKHKNRTRYKVCLLHMSLDEAFKSPLIRDNDKYMCFGEMLTPYQICVKYKLNYEVFRKKMRNKTVSEILNDDIFTYNGEHLSLH